MRCTRTFFLFFLLFPFLVLAQKVNDEDQGLIEEIFKKHDILQDELIATRGFYPTYHFENREYIASLEKYKNKSAILVYTFLQDTLQLLIIKTDYNFYKPKINHSKNTAFGKRYKNYNLIRTNYSKSKLIEDINKLNIYFSSRNLSKLIAGRGSMPRNLKLKEKEFQTIFSKVNDVLLPKELMLEDVEHLIIVPSLNIGTVPFSALKIEGEYLIDKMSYSIAPSLSSLTKEDRYRTNGFKKALFISNPIFPKEDKWNFDQLPGTEKEVQSITSNLDKDNFLILNEKMATKANVVDNIENYDLLYFATHGYSDVNNSLDNSFIALSGEDVSNAFLTPKEIQHKKLSAKLVVLSACQTGLGVTHEGGIIGLSRAFQLAGADHVLMSLWNIDDKETAKIMSEFFMEYMNNGEFISPHEAIRKAVIKYKTEINSDPRYWAAFSVFGIPYSDNVIDLNLKLHLNIENPLVVKELKDWFEKNNLGKIVDGSEFGFSDLKIEEGNNPSTYKIGLMRESMSPNNQYSELDIEGVKDIIFQCAFVNYIKKIDTKVDDYKFDFMLLPVEFDEVNEAVGDFLPLDDFLNKEGDFQIKEEDLMVLQVTNKGSKPLYFNIFEIHGIGELYPLFPNENCLMNVNELKLDPGEIKVFKDCLFNFSPPYEKYILKALVTSNPVNFNDLYMKNGREGFQKFFGQIEVVYTKEFEYEIVKE